MSPSLTGIPICASRAARAIVVAGLLAWSIASPAQTAATPDTKAKAGSAPMAMPSGKMQESMMQGMKEMGSMPMSGDTDRDFAMMMRKHHQGGVDMARMELQSGKDPTMRRMAKSIIASQEKEIREFDRWLAQGKPGESKR